MAKKVFQSSVDNCKSLGCKISMKYHKLCPFHFVQVKIKALTSFSAVLKSVGSGNRSSNFKSWLYYAEAV